MTELCYFSIIVPVYNAEDYLDRCVESILGQTFQDYELILLNDQSSDNSLALCMGYSSKYTNIHTYDLKHCGASQARNHGIEKAKGKYIIFVDADDYIQEELLLRVYNDVSRQKPDVCYLGRHYVEVNNQKREHRLIKTDHILNSVSVSPNIYLQKIVEYSESIPGSMWLIVANREFLIEKEIRLNSDYVWSEDSDFCYNIMINADKISVSDYAGYVWCVDNAGSVSKGNDIDKIVSRMEVYKKWYFYFKNVDIYEEKVKNYVGDYLLKNYCSCLVNYAFLKNVKDRTKVKDMFVKDGIWKQTKFEQFELFYKYGLEVGRIIYKYKSYLEKIKNKF